jgi:hypothetical protein
MTTAERNRALKKVLEQAFGRGKVRVRGSRGTAYGWVSVKIAFAPRNLRESQELRSKVMALIAAAKIEIGTYGYDDPGSDYGFGKTINVTFEDCREKHDSHGDQAWRHHLSAEAWDDLYKQEEKAA